MKKIISLAVCLLASVAMAKSDSKRISGELDWNKGKWTCTAVNDTDSTLQISAVLFDGEGRGRNGGMRTQRITDDSIVKPGETYTSKPNYLHNISYARYCTIFYKEVQ